jgi:hypothetical protein
MDIVDYGPEGGFCVDNLEVWANNMYDAINNMDRVLKVDHVIVFIVGEVYGKYYPPQKYKEVICLDREVMNLVDKFGPYRLLGRVSRPFGETKGGATSGAKNENVWKYRRLNTGLWSLSIDHVLFYQKLS